MVKDDLSVFYNNLTNYLSDDENSEKYKKYFYNHFLAGDTTVYQKYIAEFKNFDNEWIEKLEEYLPSIDKIVRNPKSTLRYDEEIVIIEKAKKVTSTAIRHLAANSHLIKDIDENGDVRPNKLLSTNAEVEYGIYENRFIMTLIKRLGTFVGNRFEVIKNNIQSFQKKHLNLTSNFDINNTNVNLTFDMVIKSEVDDSELQERNEKLLDRVTKLYKSVHGFLISPFMRELENKKPVIPPIMKTNIILKNPDFRNAYNLWLFLDKYNSLVYDIDVQEKDLDMDPKYVASLNELSLLSYAYINYNQENRKEEYASKDMVQYTRKATKIVKVNPRDVVENPDSIAMEDNSANEYYLDQSSKMFKKSLVDMLGDDTTSYKEALKSAMKQTMDITNNLYKSVFEMNPSIRVQVDDVFEKTDLEKSLEEAKRKAEIAKIVRESKESDFKESINLEKQHLEMINELNKELLKKNIQKTKKTKDEEVKEKLSETKEDIRAEIQEASSKKIEVLKSIEELSKIKQELMEEQRLINEKLQAEVTEELIAAEKEKAKLERQELLARMREERMQAIERERELFREARDKLRSQYKLLHEQIIQEELEIRQMELEKLQEQFKERRERELERVRLQMQG